MPPADGSLVEIAERKRAEEECKRLYQASEQARQAAETALEVRNQLLSIASHELRAPLTPLLGYSRLLRQAQAPDGRHRRLVEAIEYQVRRLNTLIGTLFDVARLQHGPFTLEPRHLDLAALVAYVVDEFRLTLPAADGSGHTVTLLRPDEPLPVLGDASLLEAVLHNLRRNAVNYSPAGGMVRVRVVQQDGGAVLEVADAGIGIPTEAQARLFEPFYRVVNVGPRTSGFGLGLPIVQEIVQRHGGHVAVTSTEGQGTTVRMVLPLRERKP